MKAMETNNEKENLVVINMYRLLCINMFYYYYFIEAHLFLGVFEITKCNVISQSSKGEIQTMPLQLLKAAICTERLLSQKLRNAE